jgi:hypothetical protein
MTTIHQPVRIQHPLGPCDCLNWCGDDERVKAGSVRECERHRDRRLQMARAERQTQQLRELGYADTLQALEALHAITRPATVTPIHPA